MLLIAALEVIAAEFPVCSVAGQHVPDDAEQGVRYSDQSPLGTPPQEPLNCAAK